MTLQASGFIDLSDVQTEHGGSNPIKMSEYYLGGGIDEFRQETITASSLNVVKNTGFSAFLGTIPPVINSGNTVYKHEQCADNGSTGDIDVNFRVNKTGTYNMRLGHYCDCSHSGRAVNYDIYVNGVKKIDVTVGNGSYTWYYTTLAVNANDLIRVTAVWPSSGWSLSLMSIGGDAYNTRTLTTQGNTGLPKSGTIRMSDFYGTTNY